MPFVIFRRGSFAVHIGDHLRFGIICGPIWGSFAVGDHLRRCTDLLDSFHFYVSSDDRDILANCIAGNVHLNEDELLDFFSSFKCYRNPTEQSIREIILEIAHQEILQKPRFVANCWSPVFIKVGN